MNPLLVSKGPLNMPICDAEGGPGETRAQCPCAGWLTRGGKRGLWKRWTTSWSQQDLSVSSQGLCECTPGAWIHSCPKPPRVADAPLTLEAASRPVDAKGQGWGPAAKALEIRTCSLPSPAPPLLLSLASASLTNVHRVLPGDVSTLLAALQQFPVAYGVSSKTLPALSPAGLSSPTGSLPSASPARHLWN